MRGFAQRAGKALQFNYLEWVRWRFHKRCTAAARIRVPGVATGAPGKQEWSSNSGNGKESSFWT